MKGNLVNDYRQAYCALADGFEFVLIVADEPEIGLRGFRAIFKEGKLNDAVKKLAGFERIFPQDLFVMYLGQNTRPQCYLVEDETRDEVLQALRSTGHSIQFD